MENIFESIENKSFEKGIAEGIERIVIRMLKKGKSKYEIMENTGVSEETLDVIASRCN